MGEIVSEGVPEKKRPFFVYDPILMDFLYFYTSEERDQYFHKLKEEVERVGQHYPIMEAAIKGKVEDFFWAKDVEK